MSLSARPDDVRLNPDDLAAEAFLASHRVPTGLQRLSQPDELGSTEVSVWIVMTALSAAITAVVAVVSLILR